MVAAMGDTAKSIVLQRVRSALVAAPPAPVLVARDYDHEPLHGPGDMARFVAAAADYRARVLEIAAGDIGPTVASLVSGGLVVLPADVPPRWVAGVTSVTDEPPLSTEQLERAVAVITGCALGIAATGTIVLDAGATQGRRALTLIPDHHICVVFARQIVDTVPQAFAALDPLRPLTFISGPSATSDIELQRVEGVHGPRILDVLVVTA